MVGNIIDLELYFVMTFLCAYYIVTPTMTKYGEWLYQRPSDLHNLDLFRHNWKSWTSYLWHHLKVTCRHVHHDQLARPLAETKHAQSFQMQYVDGSVDRHVPHWRVPVQAVSHSKFHCFASHAVNHIVNFTAAACAEILRCQFPFKRNSLM